MTDELVHLHDDHRAMQPAVDAIRATADKAGAVPAAALRDLVASNRSFLDTELGPHLRAEDDVLYPALQDVLHSPNATVGMAHDHLQIRALADEVAQIAALLETVDVVPPDLANRVRRVFYGLYALLITHFEKEEVLYLPHLRRALDADRTAGLVAQMEASVASYKQGVGGR